MSAKIIVFILSLVSVGIIAQDFCQDGCVVPYNIRLYSKTSNYRAICLTSVTVTTDSCLANGIFNFTGLTTNNVSKITFEGFGPSACNPGYFHSPNPYTLTVLINHDPNKNSYSSLDPIQLNTTFSVYGRPGSIDEQNCPSMQSGIIYFSPGYKLQKINNITFESTCATYVKTWCLDIYYDPIQ